MKEELHQYCTFWVSGRLFGVSILDVNEISREVNFFPIFHAPKEVSGFINIRGQVYLVMDINLILGFNKKPLDEESRVLIFKRSVADAFGILIDKIGDILYVKKEQIEDRRSESKYYSGEDMRTTMNSELISGICKLDQTLMIILNARNFLTIINNYHKL